MEEANQSIQEDNEIINELMNDLIADVLLGIENIDGSENVNNDSKDIATINEQAFIIENDTCTTINLTPDGMGSPGSTSLNIIPKNHSVQQACREITCDTIDNDTNLLTSNDIENDTQTNPPCDTTTMNDTKENLGGMNGCRDLEASIFLDDTISSIPADINNGNRQYVKFTPSKRPPTAKMLDKEAFRYDVYRNDNQTGFITIRPLEWLEALETYAEIGHVNCRWESKRSKDNKYSEYKLHIITNKIKHTILILKLCTGMLIVKGPSFKLWVEKEFEILQNLMNPLEESKIPPPIDVTTPAPKNKSLPPASKENEDELNSLWEENATLKRAVVALEADLAEKSLQRIEESKGFEATIDALKNKLEEVEKHYDTKLKIFTEAIDKTINEKVENIRRSFNEKLDKALVKTINTTVNTMDEPMYEQPIESIDDLQNQIDVLKADLIEMDTAGIKLELVNDREENEHLYKSMKEDIQAIEETNTRLQGEIHRINRETKQMKANLLTVSSNTPVASANPIPTTATASVAAVTTESNIAMRDTSLRAPTIDNNTELIILMDSNSKFIEFKRLWSMNKTKIRRCGNLYEVTNFLHENTSYTNLKYILINVGVNDVDENSGVAVFNMTTQIVDDIRQTYPGLKIILGEITPRKDGRDDEVKVCNRLFHELSNTTTDIYIARHGNLRHPNGYFLSDTKHIKETCIGRFVANLKNALRKAYGLYTSNNHRSEYTHQYNGQYQQSQHYSHSSWQAPSNNYYEGWH